MASMRIPTGLKKYDIEDMEGNVLDCFYFNPTDVDIVDRYQESVEKIEMKLEEIAKMEELANDDIDSVCKMHKLLRPVLCKAIDDIFKTNISEKFFSIMSPFTLFEDGTMFYEIVLMEIAKIIEEECNQRLKKVDVRISKYTSKYRK